MVLWFFGDFFQKSLLSKASVDFMSNLNDSYDSVHVEHFEIRSIKASSLCTRIIILKILSGRLSESKLQIQTLFWVKCRQLWIFLSLYYKSW